MPVAVVTIMVVVVILPMMMLRLLAPDENLSRFHKVLEGLAAHGEDRFPHLEGSLEPSGGSGRMLALFVRLYGAWRC